MTKLTLTNCVQGNTTLIDNEFIDKYMPKANGEYVKIYLLLLRYLNDPAVEITVSKIADILDDTEKDVMRALNYWKKEGLLDFETGGKSSARNITSFKNRRELKELLFVAEQYLGKTLSVTEINAIYYFHDSLGMSADLIDYLIEYCVENGHKSIHYIQKVALSWAEQNIATVEQAKMNTVLYNKNCYAVLNAYGIKGRSPAASEVAYIRRWNEEYGFSLELILEACSRTMNMIHQPNFEYTETILKNWLENGVRHPSDIAVLDQKYREGKDAKKKQAQAMANFPSKNKFNNFEGRTYENMDELTRKLIKTQ